MIATKVRTAIVSFDMMVAQPDQGDIIASADQATAEAMDSGLGTVDATYMQLLALLDEIRRNGIARETITRFDPLLASGDARLVALLQYYRTVIRLALDDVNATAFGGHGNVLLVIARQCIDLDLPMSLAGSAASLAGALYARAGQTNAAVGALAFSTTAFVRMPERARSMSHRATVRIAADIELIGSNYDAAGATLVPEFSFEFLYEPRDLLPTL